MYVSYVQKCRGHNISTADILIGSLVTLCLIRIMAVRKNITLYQLNDFHSLILLLILHKSKHVDKMHNHLLRYRSDAEAIYAELSFMSFVNIYFI